MLNNYPFHLDEKVKESFDLESTAALENSAINVLFNVSDDTDYSKGYTSLEGGTGVDYFGESANINDVSNKEGYKTVLVSDEFGGKIVVTKKEMNNVPDATTLFDKVISKRTTTLVSDTANFLEVQSMKMLNLGFTTALAPDAVEIFGAHTYKSTGAAFDNGSVTVAGEAAITELEKYAGAFTDANGKPLPFSPTTIVAKKGGSAAKAFKLVMAGDNKLQSNTIANVNIYNNGTYTLIESPFITSDTAWFAYDSRKENALIVDFIKRPSLNPRITRENLDEVTIQDGSFRYGCVELPVYWYGSTGLGS
jgi:hypothetical protein